MNVPVLLYHKISRPRPDTRVRGGFTPAERFSKQMNYLKRQGFVFYTAAELMKHFEERGKFPARGITLTFDDGWKDNYTNAFPVLKQFGIKATVFLVPASVGQMSSGATADGELPHEHLSREEVLEMSRNGIEFGSHTLSHKILTELPEAHVRSEVEQGKSEIENLVQKPCLSFAYPAGFFSDTAKRVVREAGHTCAFSSVYGPKDPIDMFALNRTEILRRDRFTFQFARKVRPFQ